MTRALQPPFSRLTARIAESRTPSIAYYRRAARIYGVIAAVMLALATVETVERGLAASWITLYNAALMAGLAFQMALAGRRLDRKTSTRRNG